MTEKKIITYKCTSDTYEILPGHIQKELNIRYPQAHLESREMKRLAVAYMNHRGDGLVKLPFCVSLEAEALGASINFGDAVNGPRVSDPPLKTEDDIIKFCEDGDVKLSEREQTVIQTLASITNVGTAVFSVTGPFTVASLLIEQKVLYRMLRRNPDLMKAFFAKVETHIVGLIEMTFQAGIRVISYADPVGGPDIVGPKIFQNHSAPLSLKILDAIRSDKAVSAPSGAIIHICPKLSYGLCSIGAMKTEPLECKNKSYSDVLRQIPKLLNQDNGEISFLGHRCIKQSTVKQNQLTVHRLY